MMTSHEPVAVPAWLNVDVPPELVARVDAAHEALRPIIAAVDEWVAAHGYVFVDFDTWREGLGSLPDGVFEVVQQLGHIEQLYDDAERLYDGLHEFIEAPAEAQARVIEAKREATR
jgi:hypothetical protein